MAADIPRPKRRWSRARLAAVVLLVVGTLIGVDAYWRHRRVQWLISEIGAVGGSVQMTAPLLQQLRHGRWKNLDQEVCLHLGGTYVPVGTKWEHFPTNVNGEWLREHDYLTGLKINNLQLLGSTLTGAELAGLIERHPIESFVTSELKGSDAVAPALANCPTVREVWLEGSDLTDDGFRVLPLEQLTNLVIPRMQLSSAALRELRRCSQLEGLWVDGSQADTVIETLLESNRPLIALRLEGAEIIDHHLERLHELQLQELILSGTSASEEAVEALGKKLPLCDIEVISGQSE